MDAVSQGHYYRKQLGCDVGIISWSHGTRFRVGLELLGTRAERVLDYGCGDGTFLAMATDRIGKGVGADIAEEQVVDCATRFAPLANLTFCTIPALSAPEHAGRYTVVTCMETLEHCTAPIVERVLSDLARLVAPDGRVIISVPIEIGPTFVLKTVIRRLAAARGHTGYDSYERYTVANTMRMLLATSATSLERPTHGDPESPMHSHYGFNWRALRERVGAHLTVVETRFSPLGFLGGWFSSQAWFICRPK